MGRQESKEALKYPQNGVRCDKCNRRRYLVSDSRATKGGKNRRRLHCTACGEVWTTYELSMKDYRQLVQASIRLEQIQEAYGHFLKVMNDGNTGCEISP